MVVLASAHRSQVWRSDRPFSRGLMIAPGGRQDATNDGTCADRVRRLATIGDERSVACAPFLRLPMTIAYPVYSRFVMPPAPLGSHHTTTQRAATRGT